MFCKTLKVMSYEINSARLRDTPHNHLTFGRTLNVNQISFHRAYNKASITAYKSSHIFSDQNGNENDVIEEELKVHIGTPLSQRMKFRGKVDSGYGRGGKKLGIPTANLPESLFSNALKDVAAGVYFGWAVIEGDGPDQAEPKSPKKTRKTCSS